MWASRLQTASLPIRERARLGTREGLLVASITSAPALAHSLTKPLHKKTFLFTGSDAAARRSGRRLDGVGVALPPRSFSTCGSTGPVDLAAQRRLARRRRLADRRHGSLEAERLEHCGLERVHGLQQRDDLVGRVQDLLSHRAVKCAARNRCNVRRRCDDLNHRFASFRRSIRSTATARARLSSSGTSWHRRLQTKSYEINGSRTMARPMPPSSSWSSHSRISQVLQQHR